MNKLNNTLSNYDCIQQWLDTGPSTCLCSLELQKSDAPHYMLMLLILQAFSKTSWMNCSWEKSYPQKEAREVHKGNRPMNRLKIG